MVTWLFIFIVTFSCGTSFQNHTVNPLYNATDHYNSIILYNLILICTKWLNCSKYHLYILYNSIFNLTLKAPNKIAADDILIFFFYLSEKIRLVFPHESSAQQRIHLKYQVLFSLKNNEKIFMNAVCCKS